MKIVQYDPSAEVIRKQWQGEQTSGDIVARQMRARLTARRKLPALFARMLGGR